jgi:hypothetical protein
VGATDARERTLADSQFGGGATTWAPATWYLGLSTTAPNEDGTGFVEPVGGSYARVTITNNATNFPAATTAAGVTTKTNGIAFTFTNPTGTWGSINYYGFFTALTGGTPEYWNPLDVSITVKSGNTPVEFAASQLVMPWD